MSTYSSPQQRGLDLLTIIIDELIDDAPTTNCAGPPTADHQTPAE